MVQPSKPFILQRLSIASILTSSLSPASGRALSRLSVKSWQLSWNNCRTLATWSSPNCLGEKVIDIHLFERVATVGSSHLTACRLYIDWNRAFNRVYV